MDRLALDVIIESLASYHGIAEQISHYNDYITRQQQTIDGLIVAFNAGKTRLKSLNGIMKRKFYDQLIAAKRDILQRRKLVEIADYKLKMLHNQLPKTAEEAGIGDLNAQWADEEKALLDELGRD